MTPYTAQRIRFGILAARHMLERHRLTWDQLYDLEEMDAVGWKVRDSRKAFDAELAAAQDRIYGRGRRVRNNRR